ncbi:holin [Streptomyces bohaiensis]|uniref:Holin n=1 Tax=Streptomyces bohaiensis TaxID=1431344 RepID=A0ABX1C8H1_9ACTN|nr:holin [Streptomyces bohaiensis]NJQ14233.1 holin [Streptomyces bohaiensis]
MTMLNLPFWQGASERAVRTAAQTGIATLGLETTGLLDVAWGPGLALVGSSAVLSVLTSIVSAPVGQHGPGVTESALPSPRSLRAARDWDAAG